MVNKNYEVPHYASFLGSNILLSTYTYIYIYIYIYIHKKQHPPTPHTHTHGQVHKFSVPIILTCCPQPFKLTSLNFKLGSLSHTRHEYTEISQIPDMSENRRCKWFVNPSVYVYDILKIWVLYWHIPQLPSCLRIAVAYSTMCHSLSLLLF
jgi:hypothetical protein